VRISGDIDYFLFGAILVLADYCMVKLVTTRYVKTKNNSLFPKGRRTIDNQGWVKSI